ESYENSLSGKTQIKALANYSIPKRIVSRLFNKSIDKNREMLFWAYGTAAYCSLIEKWWYRINLIVWETARYYFSKNKNS
ncbi:MAG: hypothetical protein ACI4ES_05440, partial [Roseburia sp.]